MSTVSFSSVQTLFMCLHMWSLRTRVLGALQVTVRAVTFHCATTKTPVSLFIPDRSSNPVCQILIRATSQL